MIQLSRSSNCPSFDGVVYCHSSLDGLKVHLPTEWINIGMCFSRPRASCLSSAATVGGCFTSRNPFAKCSIILRYDFTFSSLSLVSDFRHVHPSPAVECYSGVTEIRMRVCVCLCYQCCMQSLVNC